MIPASGSALHTYVLHTGSDGSISGTAWTNDNLDLGYPSEEADWPVRYADLAGALKSTGGTHRGVNGCHVQVLVDGVDISLP